VGSETAATSYFAADPRIARRVASLPLATIVGALALVVRGRYQRGVASDCDQQADV